MQLPPADELVMISGLAPIRAKKLRYYEDRNFQNRLAPPPALAVGPYADRPQARPDDWAGIVRPTDSRPGIAGDNEAMAEEEGGLQHPRHPGLRSEERRGGKRGVSTGSTQGGAYEEKKKNK